VHRYYQEQYQLDGGLQNRYATASDAAGLTMGTYDTTQLPVYKYLHAAGHPSYTIADNFFAGAFGGSFINHQWLIAAATPTFAGAPNDAGASDLHSVVDANGMPASSPLYASPLGAAVKDASLTASCSPPAGRPATPAGVKCGDFAVNTIQPAAAPNAPGTGAARMLPPLTGPTIGDELSGAGVDWAWYSGGWSNANGEVDAPGWTNGHGPACSDAATITGATYPNCPDALFQFHHQPFNYYAAYAPGTAARAQHLRDEQQFLTEARSTSSCNLKPVSFVKPIGAENEHPGYTGEAQGSSHLVSLLQAVSDGACAKDTVVVVTYDEFGGQWDHVSPPGQGNNNGPHDVWGPGTRVPALLVAPRFKGGFAVDHTSHDTTSILATIEHRFGLASLGTRDAAVADLSSSLTGLDTTAPVITVPSDISVTQTTVGGAAVSYVVTSSDPDDSVATSSCTPASGSTFAVGATTVKCSATDTAGNSSSASFTVKVTAAGPPVITVPAFRTLGALIATGLVVNYDVTAKDPIDGAIPATCSPPSGSTLPVGTTTVTCTATDKSGRTATKTFDVTVEPPGSDQAIGAVKIEAAKTSGNAATVTVACVGPDTTSCTITLELLTPMATSAKAKHARAKAGKRTVDLSGGAKQTVRLQLSAAATRKLRARHRLSVRLRVSEIGGKTKTRQLVFKG